MGSINEVKGSIEPVAASLKQSKTSLEEVTDKSRISLEEVSDEFRTCSDMP